MPGGAVDMQDFMVICPGAASFAEALEWTAEVYRAAGRADGRGGQAQGVADEGGCWPAFETNEEALEMLVARHRARRLQAPASRSRSRSTSPPRSSAATGATASTARAATSIATAWAELLLGWLERYPIVSIEDPLAEDDPEGMTAFTAAAGERVQIIGDDFL